MKQLFRFWVVATLLFMTGCIKEHDDSALVGRVDDLENRVSKLEQLCQQMNSNISSLQTIVTALQSNDCVTGVTPITQNGNTIGYTITFAKAQSITIYHGKDGQNGEDSDYVPAIGVKQDSNGVYYWMLDGEWLLDDAGNKVKAIGIDGKDGQDGTDGTDGKDGITPQLKIENDYWYVSYDNGAAWLQLGKATGNDGKDGQDGTDGIDGKSFFQDVTQDDNNVYFTLADGTVITVPKGLALSIAFNEADLVVMSPNSTRNIGYTVTSATESVTVEVTSSADIKAKVVADNENGLTGKIEIKTGETIDEYSKVIVFISNDNKVIMHSIIFEEAGLEVEENVTKFAAAEGGELTLEFLSNVECEAVIPEDAKSWISVVPASRALEKQTITLKLEPNEGYYRSATVTVKSSDGTLTLEYIVEQEGDLGVEIDPTAIPDNEIWYRTIDNQKYDFYGRQPFNASIVSHTYENGIGKIICDKVITKINQRAFGIFGASNLSELYLPDTIEIIETYGITGNAYLTTLRIPQSLKEVKEGGLNNPNLESFTGFHISEDGRCVIIDGVLYAFAPKGVKIYETPNGVDIIGVSAFAWNDDIEEITFAEGLTRIEGDAFADCSSLKKVTFPSTLQSLHSYAFRNCLAMEGYYGNEKFHTSDNRCLIAPEDNPAAPISWQGNWIIAFAGANVTDYTIPEGIVGIENYAFSSKTSLKSVTIPGSVVHIGAHAFENCVNLESVYGPNVTEDKRAFAYNDEFGPLIARKDMPANYYIPDNITSIGYKAFNGCSQLESVVMGDQVAYIGGYAFSNCTNLKSVTLSAGLRMIGDKDGWFSGTNPFLGSENIETIFCRALVPPYYDDEQMSEFPNLKFYVPEQSLALYKNNEGWSLFKKYFVGYQYDDLGYYISSDFSQDGKVTTLQTAAKGDGIDIVLMGDAYSDRQVTYGKYKTDMEYIYNNLFTEEPYKSFKDYFNVYYVNVVSATEGYEHGGTALGGYFGDGTLAGGNDNVVFNYALKAISEEEMDEAMLIVAMNSDNYAGTCWMYYPDNNAGYGNGVSVAYFPRGGNVETFAQLLHHEACGHGFAKLADEYAYDDMGAVPNDYVAEIQSQQANWGWWKNVDFTSNPYETRWSHFINDSRYANEGLGAYEGGLTYWTGVWRPTENSIMRYNTGGFNAPSREAIYYRIHKLAYGADWEYDYEEFVEWDAKNRMSAATRAIVYKPTNYKPTHPPVIVKKSWNDAR